MEWEYSYPANEATHLATKARFRVTYRRGSSDLTVAPMGDADKLPAGEKSRLVEALRQHITQEVLRHELQALIGQKCGNDLAAAARAISLVSGRTVTTRTIQSWLIEQGRPSSRNCPEWAVAALREKEAAGSVANWLERKAFHEDPHAAVNEVRHRTGVLRAADRMEEEERRRVRWKKVPASDLPASIAEAEMSLLRWVYALQDREHAIYEALKHAKSFEEFQEKALAMREAISQIDFEVEQARRDMESDAREGEKQ